MAGGRSGGVHLLEVGLDWPPETFLQWKFERLVALGFDITVASVASPGRAPEPLAGVRLVQTLDGDGRRSRKLLGVLTDGLALAATNPAGLLKLVQGLRRTAPPAGAPARWRRARRSLPMHLRLARLKPDVVHFEWEQAAVACQPLLDVWNRPLVMSCHGVLNFAPYGAVHRSWLQRLSASFRSAAAVCCVCEPLRDRAIQYGADADKTVLVPSAVDPGFFVPRRRVTDQDGPLRAIAVGGRRWVKGYEYALTAVSQLVDRGIPVTLDILGGDLPPEACEASERERILLTVDDLGLHDHVHMHGKVGSSEVRRLLQRADLFLNSSVSEGVPTAILEAMACAVPVVASACGGVEEAVRDGVEGIVVPPRDPEATAAAMARLWADPELRARMGAAGRRRVEEAFVIERQVDFFAGLYQRLSAGGQTSDSVTEAAA